MDHHYSNFAFDGQALIIYLPLRKLVPSVCVGTLFLTRVRCAKGSQVRHLPLNCPLGDETHGPLAKMKCR